jgi:Domain of unknown function (DUF3883)
MITRFKLNTGALRAFDTTYDITLSDIASQTRGDFLKAFPKEHLNRLSLEKYVIGHQTPTFCAYVEAKTRAWANIQGATAIKFGIYFGRTKSDPKKFYRYNIRKYSDMNEAFRAVKATLLDLVRLGGEKNINFSAIDANPLSQMFKAKILSLYYPDRFLNVCSSEHLEMLGDILGCPKYLPVSQYQHLLLKAKQSNSTTRNWLNPKFMAFLYNTYVRANNTPTSAIKKPRKKTHRKVNFEDVQNQRNEIGKAAEEFALEWEKDRLSGENLEKLIPKIKDRRERPGYGYDFLSHASPKKQRFIEVKSVGKLSKGEGYRFFLSDNEHSISISAEHRKDYFFYLVLFNEKKEPIDLRPILASDLYKLCNMTPASYVVRFDM